MAVAQPLRLLKYDEQGHLFDPQTLEKDIDRYRQMALDLGATAAVSLKGADVIIDERVHQKCKSPRCRHYATCAHCPPHYEPKADDVRKLLSKYRLGVMIRKDFDPYYFCGKRDSEQVEGFTKKTIEFNTIVAKLESQAYYDGYYFAVGFGGGSCKGMLCRDIPCTALEPEGQCRFPLRARASGTGTGIDYLATATKFGWPVYIVGKATDPASLPCVSRYGIVLMD